MEVIDPAYPALARRVAERRAVQDARQRRLPKTTTVRERVRRAARAWQTMVLDVRWQAVSQRAWVEAGNEGPRPLPGLDRRRLFVRGYVEACERLGL